MPAPLDAVGVLTVPPNVFVSVAELEPLTTVSPLRVKVLLRLSLLDPLVLPLEVEGALVMLMLPVVVTEPEAVEEMVSSPAESEEQTAFPAFCACTRSVALQLLRRQLRAALPIADLVGPHWHDTSFKLQPTWVMAAVRQGILGRSNCQS